MCILFGQVVGGNSDKGMWGDYAVKRILRSAMPGLSGELLITFLLQQAPKDGLEGGSSKALTSWKQADNTAGLLLHVGQRENRKSEHAVYKGALRWRFLVFVFGDAQFLYVHSLRGNLKEVGQVAFAPMLTSAKQDNFVVKRAFLLTIFLVSFKSYSVVGTGLFCSCAGRKIWSWVWTHLPLCSVCIGLSYNYRRNIFLVWTDKCGK